MIESRGYLVRGFLDGGAAYAIGMEWTYEGGDPPERYATIDAAAAALERMVATGCADVRIFSVAPDGTETPLPTYEEALNALAMARDATPAATGAAAIQPGNVVILRDVGSDRSHWSVSFDGPNPAESRCVRCADRGEAEKLKAIVLGGSR